LAKNDSFLEGDEGENAGRLVVGETARAAVADAFAITIG